MKKYFISMIALVALAACSKSEDLPVVNPDNKPVPILYNAGIETAVESRAPVTGTSFPANTTDVFRTIAYQGNVAPTTDWSTPYFNKTSVNSGAASLLSLATPQYYPVDGNKVYFYAWAPAETTLTDGTASAAPVANFTITGQEDIMAAKVDSGISKDSGTQPAFVFEHKLKQVSFKVKTDGTFIPDAKVTKIEISQVKTSAKLALDSGAVTFDSTPLGDLGVYDDATGVTITAGGVEVPGAVMFEAGTTFDINVTAGGQVFSAVRVVLQAGNAGQSHLVTLTFKRSEVVPTATITDWTPGEGGNVDIK